jgi:hypothetical protein
VDSRPVHGATGSIGSLRAATDLPDADAVAAYFTRGREVAAGN